MDIGFDASNQLVGGRLSPATTASLSRDVSTRSISRIVLITDQSPDDPAVKARINTLRMALGVELRLLEPETSDCVLAPEKVPAQFGREAPAILKALKDPQPVQDLILLEACQPDGLSSL